MTLQADRPVVLIAEELAPAAIEVLADDFDVRHVDGTDRPALLAALADAHAVLVRSATQIDAQAIAATPSSGCSLAKGGLHALTRNLAIELAQHRNESRNQIDGRDHICPACHQRCACFHRHPVVPQHVRRQPPIAR